jgi:DNA-binding ferritin-like protein (Dps family)
MTKRDKILLLSSILLACCVIVTAFFLIKTQPEYNTVNRELMPLITVVLIIFISIASVLLVLFKIKKLHRGKAEGMLTGDYYRHYEVIRDAIANSQLSGHQKKEIKDDLLDLLISAQRAGKDAGMVTGNPERFARDILHSFARPSRFAILSLFDGAIWFLSFIVGINTLLWFENIGQSYFSITIDAGMVILIFIITVILVPLTKKLTSTKNPWMFMLPLAFGIAYVVLLEILRRFLCSLDAIRWLLDGQLNLIPDPVVLICYICVFVILVVCKKLFRSKLLR